LDVPGDELNPGDAAQVTMQLLEMRERTTSQISARGGMTRQEGRMHLYSNLSSRKSPAGPKEQVFSKGASEKIVMRSPGISDTSTDAVEMPITPSPTIATRISALKIGVNASSVEKKKTRIARPRESDHNQHTVQRLRDNL
jgi:hypothetical protein